ncbi:YsnF/AvaK domain-containing protein [Spirosoma fluminis]
MNLTPQFSEQEEPHDQPQQVITPVFEEQVHIDKRIVETGQVTIVKKVHEKQQAIEVPVVHENVRVERVPINQYVDSAPPVRQEGETMIIPVIQEVLITEKRLLLVEEVHVTRERTEERDIRQVTLRQEEVHIERTSNS